MNKKPLTLLIAGLLGSTSAWTQHELTLVQIGEKTVERLESIKAMAERGEGVFERNGERWIRYKGTDYRLSYKMICSSLFYLIKAAMIRLIAT